MSSAQADGSSAAAAGSNGDGLSLLIGAIGLQARSFFSGRLCGEVLLGPGGEIADRGILHVLRAGRLEIAFEGRQVVLQGPALLWFARPAPHRLLGLGEGADLACAGLGFSGIDPFRALGGLGLRAPLILDLTQEPTLQPMLALLLQEVAGGAPGRGAMLDRMLELLLIQVLRDLLAGGRVEEGMLAALAEPRLGRVMAAMVSDPAGDWSLERLSEIAAMSRSSFAALFKERLGLGPHEFLIQLRLGRARQMLLEGLALKEIAAAVGYGSATALTRAFRDAHGHAPREWLRAQT